MKTTVRNLGFTSAAFSYLSKPDASSDSEDRYSTKSEAHQFDNYSEAAAWVDAQGDDGCFAIGPAI